MNPIGTPYSMLIATIIELLSTAPSTKLSPPALLNPRNNYLSLRTQLRVSYN